jgi:hypothetical protein
MGPLCSGPPTPAHTANSRAHARATRSAPHLRLAAPSARPRHQCTHSSFARRQPSRAPLAAPTRTPWPAPPDLLLHRACAHPRRRALARAACSRARLALARLQPLALHPWARPHRGSSAPPRTRAVACPGPRRAAAAWSRSPAAAAAHAPREPLCRSPERSSPAPPAWAVLPRRPRVRRAARAAPAKPQQRAAPPPPPLEAVPRKGGQEDNSLDEALPEPEMPGEDKREREREEEQRRRRNEIPQGLMHNSRKLQGLVCKAKFPIDLKPE